LARVLVLNATYEPLNVVSVRRAVVLLLKDKAELIEATEARLRAESLTLPMPSVIRLVSYVRLPHRMSLPVTRRTVLARDNYTCQYCGTTPGRSNLTVDHVIPRSREGGTTWDNVVAACKRCNQRKGNRTPTEANMPLLSRPTRPRYVALVLLRQGRAAESWMKYMY
jgi:5-methylcytosine-specific restriction endonuclease McrA